MLICMESRSQLPISAAVTRIFSEVNTRSNWSCKFQGGIRAVIWTDVFQTLLMFIGLLTISTQVGILISVICSPIFIKAIMVCMYRVCVRLYDRLMFYIF